MQQVNKTIVVNFIEDIWNAMQFDKMNEYLADDYTDHSLPPTLSPDKDGLKNWILATGKSFEHRTEIDKIVQEDDEVVLKITMHLKHIGVWRDIEPTDAEITTVGYRFYRLANNKIAEHWGLIDGNAIENQLKDIQVGCKIQK